MNKYDIIDNIVNEAFNDDEFWLILENEVLGETRCDWLAEQLSQIPEEKLRRLYDIYHNEGYMATGYSKAELIEILEGYRVIITDPDSVSKEWLEKQFKGVKKQLRK